MTGSGSESRYDFASIFRNRFKHRENVSGARRAIKR